jgi:hypothetical protein
MATSAKTMGDISLPFFKKYDKIMENPFLNIQNDLTLIKDVLHTLCQKMESGKQEDNQIDKYEQGVKVAMEELNWKEQTVYQNIDKLPKKKLHGKLYFNRAELQEYIRNEGRKQ